MTLTEGDSDHNSAKGKALPPIRGRPYLTVAGIVMICR
jgi:hypothetical protein